MKTALIFLALLHSTIAFAADPIKFGVYKLKGVNSDGIKKYDGRIVIQREGSNYRVSWFIGSPIGQAQVGIGILENQVLSIGYMDMSGKDMGVVGMKVISNKHLKGKWSSLFSAGSFGEEEFIFENEKIPEELSPKSLPKPAGSI